MNKIKMLICLLFVSTSLLAQEVEIPNDLKLENAEDYKKTEQLVKELYTEMEKKVFLNQI